MNILLCGHQGSGKSCAAKFLSRKYGFHIISANKIITSFAKEKNKELNTFNKTKYADQIKKLTVSGSIFERANLVSETSNIFDSIVSYEDFEFCSSINKHTISIGITTTYEKMYERRILRARTDDKALANEGMYGLINNNNVNELLNICDIKVQNNSSIDELYIFLDEVLKKQI